ncbi:DUF4386 domain-containing protein [Longispora sp. K20-0274]|uniref:DUF4386 domain-containing protein n=1 Tax=Longispora sp. K20-0274 TaxID=3088255 RepID=UPI0039998F74
MRSPQRLARLAGVFYLIVGLGGGFAFHTRDTVRVPGDAARTAREVAAHAGLVRAGIVADLVQITFFVFLAMALFVLLKDVHRDAARAMVTFVAIAAAMMALNDAHQVAGLLVATDPGYAGAGSDTLVLLMLDLAYDGFLIAQIFFGLWLLPLGYLVYTSRMFPRALGVLLAVGCLGYLVDTFTRFAAPDLGAAIGPYVVAPAAVAEIAMVVWLLVKGVRAPVPAA